ncbi:MAG: hypothetical protein E7513_02555 [Ruminococcaceae bacterium]|nr:hypothetical protein [Oscillospiraceae bacterium]
MKISTRINFVLSGVMWVFSLLTLLSNVFRLDYWDDCWVITVLYMSPIVLFSNIIAFVFTSASTACADIKESRRYIILNSICSVVSICVFLCTFYLLSGWIGNW